MRRILIGLVVCLFLISCKQTLPTSPTTTTITSTVTTTSTIPTSTTSVFTTTTTTIPVGANVIMTEGPIFIDGYSVFTYKGIVKNIGYAKAFYVKVYIYLRKTDGYLLDFDYAYIDSTDPPHLNQNETSGWSILFSDSDHSKRNAMNKSKTTYSIQWQQGAGVQEKK